MEGETSMPETWLADFPDLDKRHHQQAQAGTNQWNEGHRHANHAKPELLINLAYTVGVQRSSQQQNKAEDMHNNSLFPIQFEEVQQHQAQGHIFSKVGMGSHGSLQFGCLTGTDSNLEAVPQAQGSDTEYNEYQAKHSGIGW